MPFDPLQVAPLALVAFLYVRRVRVLGARGTPVPRARRLLFALGVALILVALARPVDELAEERSFTVHMAQHLLLGDLAPLALLVGLTGPILRPVLALPLVVRLRFLTHPLVALPLWLLNLYVWHLPPLYEAALTHDVVHALEHLSFFTAGILMWAPVLETLPAPEWFGSGAKLGYIVAVRLAGTLLGNVFLWSGTVFYSTYEQGEAVFGLSTRGDQATAGALMTIEGSLVTFAAFAWLFLRMAREGELRQELLERGLDPRTVKRAVRYGRAEGLPEREIV